MNNEYYDASDVRMAAGDKIKIIVKDLFPAARIMGSEARVGSLGGDKGSSLAISLNPTKFGSYFDHESGEKGDLFTMLQETKGLDYPEAIEFLAENYTSCIKRPWEPENVTPRVTLNPRDHVDGLTQPIIDYMRDTRQISQGVLEAYKVCSIKGSPHVAAFPHFQNGHVTKIAASNTVEKGFWAVGESANGLFGADYVTPQLTKGTLLITEGQIDALSMAEAGMPAVSIPSGVSNCKWITECWEYLQGFHTIKLAYDMDEPGQKALDEVARRLGVSKCLIVKMELKDASDMLQAGKISELQTAVAKAAPPETTDITPAEKYKEEVRDLLKQDRSLIGDMVFLPNLEHRLRDHEITIVYGREFSGKTVFTTNQAVYDAAKGIDTVIACFEQQPVFTLANMLMQYAADAGLAHKGEEFDKSQSYCCE